MFENLILGLGMVYLHLIIAVMDSTRDLQKKSNKVHINNATQLCLTIEYKQLQKFSSDLENVNT